MDVNAQEYLYIERDWLYPIRSGEKGFYISVVESKNDKYPYATLIIGDGEDMAEFSFFIGDETEFNQGIEALTKLSTVIQDLIQHAQERRAICVEAESTSDKSNSQT